MRHFEEGVVVRLDNWLRGIIYAALHLRINVFFIIIIIQTATDRLFSYLQQLHI